jgi:cardiolipin synthase
VLVTILTTAEVVYVVVLAVWILLEKRPPVSTIAWILALIALPYAGFVVFFFFGPRRITRKRLKHRLARGKMHERDKTAALTAKPDVPPPADPRIAQLERLAVGSGEPPSAPCENVTIYNDAASTYDAIAEAINEAKLFIHVAYYIFDSGRAGTRIAKLLMKRAEAGVTVRVLVDDVGSSMMTTAMVADMRASGIYFASFNTVTFTRIRSRIDFRNHRKIVVCDGIVGFTGGINITDDYVPEEPSKDKSHKRRVHRGQPAPWRDTHVRLQGDAVRWLQLVFLDDWQYTTGYTARKAKYFPPPSNKGKYRVQVVASGPDREFEPIQRLYFASIALAQKRVLVTTPYFIPDAPVLTALTTAALRGVDVRVLVPRLSDSAVVTYAARSYFDDLLAAGARVFEYQPTMVHSKTVVVDDFFAAVGTANMDNRSFRLNFEVTAILYGEEHAESLAKQFAKDLELSKEITTALRKASPLKNRLAEAGARLLSPLL